MEPQEWSGTPKGKNKASGYRTTTCRWNKTVSSWIEAWTTVIKGSPLTFHFIVFTPTTLRMFQIWWVATCPTAASRASRTCTSSTTSQPQTRWKSLSIELKPYQQVQIMGQIERMQEHQDSLTTQAFPSIVIRTSPTSRTCPSRVGRTSTTIWWASRTRVTSCSQSTLWTSRLTRSINWMSSTWRCQIATLWSDRSPWMHRCWILCPQVA